MVTLIVQEPCGPTDAPQSLDCEKSVLTEICEILRAAVPELVNVTGNGALLDPTFSEPNVRLLAERLAEGAVFGAELPPQPVRTQRRSTRHFLCEFKFSSKNGGGPKLTSTFHPFGSRVNGKMMTSRVLMDG